MAKPILKKFLRWGAFVAIAVAVIIALSIYAEQSRYDDAAKRYSFAELSSQDILARWQCLKTEQDKSLFVNSLIERFAPKDAVELRKGTVWAEEYSRKQQDGTLTVAERDKVTNAFGAVSFGNGRFVRVLPWSESNQYSWAISVRNCINPSDEMIYDSWTRQMVLANPPCDAGTANVVWSKDENGLNLSRVTKYLNWHRSAIEVNEVLAKVEYETLLNASKIDAVLLALQTAQDSRIALRQQAKDNVSSMPASAVAHSEIEAITEKEYLRLACQ